MSLLAIALLVAAPGSEPCSTVRREQGEFNAAMFARLERLDRAARRADGSQRPLTASERREFAKIEAETEAFIARFNARLDICRGN